MHNTGHAHGVLPAHGGMRVRFTAKVNSPFGLIQEQQAATDDFVVKAAGRERYRDARPSELFRPGFTPAACWLQVGDVLPSPVTEDVVAFLSSADHPLPVSRTA